MSVPVTVGMARPTVVLPADWRQWPDQKLRGILAHELAHVRRRDPLVGFFAHVNRCVFWFHPLAWWLERRLAVTAEHACDAAAIRELGQAQRYAEILLEMVKSLLISDWAALGDRMPGDAKVIAARRAHVLWLIEHHPESELAGSVEARLFPQGDRLADPVGYAQARRL